MVEHKAIPWRVGRKVGRTIYADYGDEVQVLIGMMDTPELAEVAVRAHNAELTRTGYRGGYEAAKAAGCICLWGEGKADYPTVAVLNPGCPVHG